MDRLVRCESAFWNDSSPAAIRRASANALESGLVLYFPNLEFNVRPHEQRFLDPTILAGAKNISYNPSQGTLGGTVCVGRDAEELRELLARFSSSASDFMHRWLDVYGESLRLERASLRPAQVEGRQSSWRKDDTRLHVDSFPSQPTGGRRILRLFCNVNPEGRARTWRIGESFEAVVRRFWLRLTPPSVWNRQVLSLLRVTKGYRSDFDHYMLRLHDAMKADRSYQRNVDEQRFDFPAGSSWACFADQVSHAVIAGQHQFEQTFSLSVNAQLMPENSPLRILEQMAGKELVKRKELSGMTLGSNE